MKDKMYKQLIFENFQYIIHETEVLTTNKNESLALKLK